MHAVTVNAAGAPIGAYVIAVHAAIVITARLPTETYVITTHFRDGERRQPADRDICDRHARRGGECRGLADGDNGIAVHLATPKLVARQGRGGIDVHFIVSYVRFANVPLTSSVELH